MRPIAVDQNYLRNPLNELLGAPANVRLLRMLAEEGQGPVSAPEAAGHTGLTEAGARRALRRLATTGFVESLGGGRSQQFRLRDSDQLVRELIRLFQAERERYQSFLFALRDALGTIHEVRLAWMDEVPSDPNDPLHIGVLAPSDTLGYLEGEIRRRILDIESRFDATVEIHTFSRADIPEVDWDTADLLAGHWPLEVAAEEGGAGRHSDRLDRAKKVSRQVAELVGREASLIRRAQNHLAYLLSQDQGAARHDLGEWHDILSHYSRQRIQAFLVSETPRAQRLRQSSPFFAVLTIGERDEVLEAIEKDDS